MDHVDILMTAPMLQSVVDELEGSFKVHRLWETSEPDALLEAVGASIRGIATNALSGRVDKALLERLPNVEIIAGFGVGYDNVDVVVAAERGIVVTNTPGVLDEEVADLTVGLLLATSRRIPQADRFVRDGRWSTGSFPLSPSLRGRRIGIVGLGAIGKAIARRLAAFDVPIAYHGRTRQADCEYRYFSTVVELAEASDVLIVIVPGGAATRHMIGAEVLRALGSDGVLINVSRGSVVDEPALISALQSGTILAAGLDVYQHEPHVPQQLFDMQNVVLLPHVGSASERTRAAMGQLMVDNLKSWFEQGRVITSVPETQANSERTAMLRRGQFIS